ncbi:hypothetical protein TKK_0000148 [Trichogramma kaykai]
MEQDEEQIETPQNDERFRTQDNVRRETAYNDEQFRTQENVRRGTTYKLSKQIPTYEEHKLTRDEEYCMSTELNDGRAESPQHTR